MIKLIVDGYCENCPEFCANAEKHIHTPVNYGLLIR
jgi:hypothetical protein